jgi:hypothetical protein
VVFAPVVGAVIDVTCGFGAVTVHPLAEVTVLLEMEVPPKYQSHMPAFIPVTARIFDSPFHARPLGSGFAEKLMVDPL